MDSAIDSARIEAILLFLQGAERLKDTLRSGRTGSGRAESVAEHSWRLCLMVMLFAKDLEGVDPLRLLKLCILHDLGEAISGDIPAPDQRPDDGRAGRERRDLVALAQPLPPDLRAEIIALWDEYDRGQSLEARLAKGFDKIETMLQHLAGRNAPDFDYHFNLTYGRAWTDTHPLTAEIRVLVDAETRKRAASRG